MVKYLRSYDLITKEAVRKSEELAIRASYEPDQEPFQNVLDKVAAELGLKRK